MKAIVTGGAGFIGSCIVAALNGRGINNIIIVDNIGSSTKWMNLVGKRYSDYIHKDLFLDKLNEYRDFDVVIHMGACSSTTELDFDYLWRNNVEYTKKLWRWCIESDTRFIYASSAATYGDGSNGFDDEAPIDILKPLNGYGYSKHVFDLWAQDQDVCPPQHVGLKFFNVYGPNEYHKESMASMVFHGFNQINSDGEIRLFKSCNPDYADGGQLRDFVYVKDVCDVILWLIDNKDISGLFNVGTGVSQSFKELAEATFEAMGVGSNIVYIPMPEHLRDKYQYFTEAKMSKLKHAGYDGSFRNLSDGVHDYVSNHLSKRFSVY